MKTLLKPTIAPVEGYLKRNNCIVPDDGGPGELVTEALFMPDGRLEPASEMDLGNVVECNGRYGITFGTSKQLAPEFGRTDAIIRVRWEDTTTWTRMDVLTPVKP